MTLYQLFQGWWQRKTSTLIFSELNTTQYHVTEMHSGNGCITDIASPEEDKIEQQSRMETESARSRNVPGPRTGDCFLTLKNPLHVIDGPEQRYFIGIIDIFTVYGFKKRLEYLWKRLRHPRKTFSTVSPPAYCHRLCQWVQDHTK